MSETTQVIIAGQCYRIQSHEEASRVLAYAKKVEEVMAEIRHDTQTVDSIRLLALTALHLAAENEALKTNLESQSNAKIQRDQELIRQIDAAMGALASYSSGNRFNGNPEPTQSEREP